MTQQKLPRPWRLIWPEAPILIVQNGVGGEELAQGVLPEATVISGVLTLSVSVVAPGHISPWRRPVVALAWLLRKSARTCGHGQSFLPQQACARQPTPTIMP